MELPSLAGVVNDPLFKHEIFQFVIWDLVMEGLRFLIWSLSVSSSNWMSPIRPLLFIASVWSRLVQAERLKHLLTSQQTDWAHQVRESQRGAGVLTNKVCHSQEAFKGSDLIFVTARNGLLKQDWSSLISGLHAGITLHHLFLPILQLIAQN